MGTEAAWTWVIFEGLAARSAGFARQYSAVAPFEYQSFIPKTSSPTFKPSPSSPTAATTPENSCPGTISRRLSPPAVYQVGCQWSSVGTTPAAHTSISTCPLSALGFGRSPSDKRGSSSLPLINKHFIRNSPSAQREV